MSVILAAGVGSLTPQPSLAQQTRMLDLNLYQQQDLRALAMGNAFGSIARGEAALQYNAAGLALYDFDLKADLGVSFTQPQNSKFIDDTQKVSSGSPSAQDVSNYITKYNGTTQSYVLQVYPSAVANLGFAYFGLGYGALDVQRWSIQFDSVANNLTIAENRAQLGMGGVGFKLFDGKAYLGTTVKQVRYSETSQQIPYTTAITNSKVSLNLQGTDYNSVSAYDAGFIYRVEWLPVLKPQWSVTGYNLGGYTLTGTNAATGVVNKLQVPDTYNFGFSLQPDLGFVHILVSIEYEDLGDSIRVQDASGVNRPKDDAQHYHAGFELGLVKTPTGNNLLSLRAGSNRGYGTYGAELNLFGFLRAVYTNGTDNLGYRGHPSTFAFEAYQVAVGLAW